jgi:hypothetical protein
MKSGVSTSKIVLLSVFSLLVSIAGGLLFSAALNDIKPLSTDDWIRFTGFFGLGLFVGAIGLQCWLLYGKGAEHIPGDGTLLVSRGTAILALINVHWMSLVAIVSVLRPDLAPGDTVLLRSARALFLLMILLQFAICLAYFLRPARASNPAAIRTEGLPKRARNSG